MDRDRVPTPLPELHEPRVADPTLRDFTFRDWGAVLVRAGKETLGDNMPLIASALAYSSFFAIPSGLLLAVGVTTIAAEPETIDDLMGRLRTIAPSEVADLLGSSLRMLQQKPATGITLTVVGLILAVWSLSGAMSAYMTGFNLAYDREDGRSFVRKRLVALAMAACLVAAVLLIVVLLVFGPLLQHWLGSALDAETLVTLVWWIAQWPLLIGGLLAAFAAMLYLGPDVEHRRFQFITPGAVIAVVVWLVISGAFSAYTSLFGSYNKTWGSLSAVIVTLTWLWLTGLALLHGAEINAEVERTRELRRGEQPQAEVQASRKS